MGTFTTQDGTQIFTTGNKLLYSWIARGCLPCARL